MFQEEIKKPPQPQEPAAPPPTPAKADGYSMSSLINILATTLGQVIAYQEGDLSLALVERIRHLAKNFRATSDVKIAEELSQIVAKLPVGQLNLLTKAFTN